MNKKANIALSILLTFVILVGMLPISAFAEGTDSSTTTYTVTIIGVEPTHATVSGAGTYAHGETATVHFEFNNGRIGTFNGWYVNGGEPTGGMEYSFTVTENVTLRPKYMVTNDPVGVLLPGDGKDGKDGKGTGLPTHGEGGNQPQASVYTVGVSYDATQGSVSGAGDYEDGNTATVEATANVGYAFVRWTENGSTVSTDNPYEFTVEGDRDLVAVFVPTYPVSVTVSPTNGGTVTINGGESEFAEGETVTLSINAASGYTFKQVSMNGTTLQSAPNLFGGGYTASFAMPAEAVTVTAEFERTYLVTLVGGGPGSGGRYTEGASVTITAPGETGKRFKAWTGTEGLTFTSGSASTAAVTFTMPARDVTLTATYEDITVEYPVTLVKEPSTGGGSVVAYLYWGVPKDSFAENETVNLNILPHTGAALHKLTVDGEDKTAEALARETYDSNNEFNGYKYSFTMPARAVTVKAEFWTAAPPQITTTSLPPGTENTAYEEKLEALNNVDFWTVVSGTLPDGLSLGNDGRIIGTPVKTGTFNFSVTAKNFYGTSAAKALSITINAASVTTHTVTYVVENGSWSNGERENRTEKVTHDGTPSNIPTDMKADDGYEGGSWDTDPFAARITSDTQFTYTFVEKPYYRINAVVETGNNPMGSVSGGGDYQKDKQATVTATPADGYKFVKWMEGENLVSTDASYSFTVTAARNLEAFFEKLPVKTFAVTVTNDGNGSVTASPPSGSAGAEVTLTATPNTGYQFLKWEIVDAGGGAFVSGTTSSSAIFKLGSANAVVKAVFEPITYTVRYTIKNGTWQDLTNNVRTESVRYKETPSLIPTGMKPDAGYEGGSWDSDPYTAQITTNTQFTYTFTAKPTYTASGTVTVQARKTLIGRPLDDGQFTFDLVNAAGEAVASATTGDGRNKNTISFPALTFTQDDLMDSAGTMLTSKDFAYTIVERDDGAPGYTYADPLPLTITVSDKGDGTLDTKISFEDGKDYLTNYYNASGQVVLKATKKLAGRSLENEQFRFEVWIGNRTVATGTNDADGNVIFTPITYNQGSARSVFFYTIREVKPDPVPAGYTYDEHVERVTVAVTDNGDGTLTATPTYDDDGAVFENTYTDYDVTVVNGTADKAKAVENETVTITAEAPAEGKYFQGWESMDGVRFADATARETTFVMPATAVTVTAVYEDILIKDIPDQVYTGVEIEPELTVELKGMNKTLTEGTDYEVAYDENVNVGDAKVTITGKGNFMGSVTGTFRIKPAQVTITVNNVSKEYGEADPAFTGTVTGLVDSGDLGTVTYNRTNSDEAVGKYTGVLDADYTPNSNYEVTVEKGDFTITALPTYIVTVNNGNADRATAAVGETITLTAEAPPTGKQFDKWVVNAGGISLADENASTTTFIMPAANVEVTATYKDSPVTPPTTITYTVAGGADSTWTKGSSATVTITVKRSEADDTCFGHFTGVEIDGKALVSGTDYTAVSGSTVITLKASALQKLSAGSHTVTVKFDDGKASTGLTVKAASGTGTSDPGKTSPKTGDESNLAMWFSMMIASLIAMVLVPLGLRKKKPQGSGR